MNERTQYDIGTNSIEFAPGLCMIYRHRASIDQKKSAKARIHMWYVCTVLCHATFFAFLGSMCIEAGIM